MLYCKVMRKKDNQICLEFVSDLKFTEFCVLVLNYVKNILHITEDDFFKVEISLREVINNAILHGNKQDLNKRVFVNFKWSKSSLSIRIKDQNPDPVNFDQVSKEIENKDLLSISGRGILIMKSYMDTVKFNSTKSGTEIFMEKKL